MLRRDTPLRNDDERSYYHYYYVLRPPLPRKYTAAMKTCCALRKGSATFPRGLQAATTVMVITQRLGSWIVFNIYAYLHIIYTRVQTNTYYIANLTITLILLCKRGHASMTHVSRIETAAADDDGLAERIFPCAQRDYRDLPRFKIASYIIIKSYTEAGHTSHKLYYIIIVCNAMGMITDEHRTSRNRGSYSLIFAPRVFKIGKT